MPLPLYLACIVAWVTHVVVSAKAGAWVFMVVGGLMVPVGVVHGVSSWFGAGWVN